MYTVIFIGLFKTGKIYLKTLIFLDFLRLSQTVATRYGEMPWENVA